MTPLRPDTSEHHEYYSQYIRQAPEGDILAIMEDEVAKTVNLLASVSEEQETYRYADNKWSLREVVGHLIDTEWTFSYRGLCFARTDPAELPGFDQELWARTSTAGNQTMRDLLALFETTRRSSLAIFRSFNEEEWLRRGIASDCPFTVRCMPFILAGHEIHHRKVIEERYL